MNKNKIKQHKQNKTANVTVIKNTNNTRQFQY